MFFCSFRDLISFNLRLRGFTLISFKKIFFSIFSSEFFSVRKKKKFSWFDFSREEAEKNQQQQKKLFSKYVKAKNKIQAILSPWKLDKIKILLRSIYVKQWWTLSFYEANDIDDFEFD